MPFKDGPGELQFELNRSSFSMESLLTMMASPIKSATIPSNVAMTLVMKSRYLDRIVINTAMGSDSERTVKFLMSVNT